MAVKERRNGRHREVSYEEDGHNGVRGAEAKVRTEYVYSERKKQRKGRDESTTERHKGNKERETTT